MGVRKINIAKNEVFVFDNKSELQTAISNAIVSKAKASIKFKDAFAISLAGGGTPKPVYDQLAKNKELDADFWSKVYLFWGDERFVPPDHDQSNYKMVKEILIDHVPISDNHIFPIPTDRSPAQSANDYEEILNDQFKSRPPIFDMMLLGLGDDAHTASIFPNTQVIHESTAWVREVFHPIQQKFRISLTAQVIKAASEIVFVATGENKALAVSQVLTQDYDPSQYPAQLIAQSGVQVTWYIDEAAARLI